MTDKQILNDKQKNTFEVYITQTVHKAGSNLKEKFNCYNKKYFQPPIKTSLNFTHKFKLASLKKTFNDVFDVGKKTITQLSMDSFFADNTDNKILYNDGICERDTAIKPNKCMVSTAHIFTGEKGKLPRFFG